MRNVIPSKGKGAVKDFMTYIDAGILQSDLNPYWDLNDKQNTIVRDYDPWTDLNVDKKILRLKETQSLGLDLNSRYSTLHHVLQIRGNGVWRLMPV